MLIGLAEWVADVVEQLGYMGLALLVALENLFPPLPSELILPLAGFLVAQERMSFFLAVIAATLGSLVGAFVLYAIGASVGEERIPAGSDAFRCSPSATRTSAMPGSRVTAARRSSSVGSSPSCGA